MKNELNPIIKAVAEHYKFEIKWCDVLNHWTIYHESHNCSFFWRSSFFGRSDDSFETFFSDLKYYFEEIGVERLNKY
jgi:hypothetical protein